MATSKGPGLKIDLGSFAGLVVALGGILGGLILEGGNIKDVAQITGGIIVISGLWGQSLSLRPPAY